MSALSPPEPPSDLRARVLDAVARSPMPDRRQVRLREVGLLIAAGAATCALFAFFGGVRVGPRPMPLVIATAVGTAVIAVAALWLGVARGKSMIGRPRAWLLATAVLAPLAYLAWKVASTVPFPEMDAAWPERPGWRCFRLCLYFAAPPFAALLYLRRRSDPVHPRAMGAAIGASVSAAATVLVDLWCPVAHLPHLVLGHLLPMALMAAAGAWLGGLFLGLGKS